VAQAIKVDGLWKEYQLTSTTASSTSLYDSLSNVLVAPFRKRAPSTSQSCNFWALRNVGFEVEQGRAIGIVGRNGAGKSTLLKILSRITAPTRGRVEVKGRLSSLLEVGTGFHPELSGRDNIFLNGAILGMRRHEIERKFDEIVAFAEVEKFIDTPVKRYSSGMYVRLAFAVAAHLEPDILIVDEVLAVGDLQFQKKCLGKLGDVATQGRTVLFVSHNLQAVRLLCEQAIALHAGEVVDNGPSSTVVSNYIARAQPASDLVWRPDAPLGSGPVRLCKCEVFVDQAGHRTGEVSSDQPFRVELTISVQAMVTDLCVGFDLLDEDGTTVLRSYQTDNTTLEEARFEAGQYTVSCQVPPGLLNRGALLVAPRIGIHNREWCVYSDPVIRLDVTLGHGQTRFWASLDRGDRPGSFAPIFQWSVQSQQEVEV